MQREPIALIGIGCRFPGARGPHEFWTLLREGKDAIGEVPASRWQASRLYDPDITAPGKTASRWGGFLDQVDRFDAKAFNIGQHEATAMDPQHRLLLEVAWEALEDAGLPFAQVAGSQTSVSIGICWNDYMRLLTRNWSQLGKYTTLGSYNGIAAHHLSYQFNLKGCSTAVDNVCSSSLTALHLACQSLWSGEASLALAGGVNLMLSPDGTIILSQTGLLSREGRTKTLDANADGFVRGEGAGVVVLKPLSLVNKTDRVYALLRSVVVNHNGHNQRITSPSQAGQETLLHDAYRKAGISPAEVGYVELHGSAFPRGDSVETQALGAVLGARPERTYPCLVGSVKTNIGHLEGASGIASLIKVALSLYHREIPPTLNLQSVHPAISLADLHLAVPRTCLPWPESAERAVAGLTALAFTGANAHAVLTAHSDTISRKCEQVPQGVCRLLPLSARSESALSALAFAYHDFLASHALAASWRDICYTASVRRTHHRYRLAVAGCTPQEAAEELSLYLQGNHHGHDNHQAQGKHKGLSLQWNDDTPLADPSSRVAVIPCACPELPSHLATLKAHYIKGAEIDWSELFEGEECRCVSLPGYAWQHERYWPAWLDSEQISTPPEVSAVDPHKTRRSDEIELAGRSVEQVLTELWADVLALSQVSASGNFFTLGGHSLLAVQLLVRIQKIFHIDIALKDLLAAPTPETCAEIVKQKTVSPANPEHMLSSLLQIEPDPLHGCELFPLTDTQQAYWVGRSVDFDMGNVGNHGYFEVAATDLDLDRLNGALQRLIERHEMLRAVLLPDGEQQILARVPPFAVKIMDLRGQDKAEQVRQLQQLRQRLDHQILPVERWPAFELWVSLLDERHVRLHLSIEFIFVDAWSLRILVHECLRFYYEPDFALPALTLSFRDYVLAEASLRSSALYERSRVYWLSRLSSLPPAPQLPLVAESGTRAHPRFVHREGRLERVHWQQLKAHAAKVEVTPSAVLLTAFAHVLATWSKTARFSLNVSTFNRLPLHPQVNEIVGDFTSLLVLAIDQETPDAFANCAKRLQEQLWHDLEHSLYSGITVLRELVKLQGEGIQAVMPIVFTSLLIGDVASPVPPLWRKMLYCVTQTPQVWLDHQVLEVEGELVFHWQSVDAIFPPGLVDAMFDAYCQLLYRLASVRANWWQDVRELLPEQQRVLLAQVNATQAPTSEKLLHTLFCEQVVQRPDQIAVISPRCALTYKQVHSGALQLAHQLRVPGGCSNQLIGVVMEKGWEQIVAVLGILHSGAAYLPLDASLPGDRLRYLLANGQVQVVVTQSWVDERIVWPKDVQRICIDDLALDDVLTPCGCPVETGDGVVQRPDDLAYVIYTSGSTGLPKGVMISHRAAVNTILDINRRFAVGSTDRVLALSALHFDLSVYDIFGLLAAGGTIVLPPAGSQRDPALWLELLLRERVTLWNSVPALLEMLLALTSASPLTLQQSSLRLALISGDWIPLSLPARVKESVPTLQLISLGGATEASIWSIMYPIEHVEPSCKSIPYGKPLCNQHFHVLNERLEPCPVWVAGQLYIGGIGLARGYWRDEAKTQASFLIHPHTGQRLYRTGDIGRYWPDGNIEFLGREDFQVKIAGHRIELGEIEAALLEHPAVSNAVVTATGKPFEHKHLIAYVVATRNGTHPIDNPQENTNWQALVTKSQHYIQALPDANIEDIFLEVWQILEHIYLQIVCKALQDFGVFRSSDEGYTVDELMQHCGIHPRYQQWVTRNLRLLARNGYLQEQHGSFKREKPLPDRLLDEWQVVYQQAAARLTDPTLLAAGWHKRFPLMPAQSMENLKSVLTEELHSAEIYLSSEIREAYRIFHTSNTMLQILMQEVVALTKEDETLHILEIGAGFGTATAYLLPILPSSRTAYSYTDISTYFLQEAQEKFAAYPFVTYQLLDIEKNPQAQGYEMQHFDVIIAASVLHATANIAQSLGHVRSLLKPHGLLLLLEETKFHPIFDLTMGLQQGFDRFADTELRQAHPLLTRDMWYEVLTHQGFSSAAILNKAGTLNEFFGFDIVLAQGPTTVAPLSLTELYEHLRSKLPAYMLPLSIIPLETLPLTANGKVDRQALPHPLLQSQKPASSTRAARTPLEKRLVEMCRKLLNIRHVGVEDNFLQLGGDSLLAIKLLTQVQTAFGVEVPARIMFKKPTLEALAEVIEQYTTALMSASVSPPGLGHGLEVSLPQVVPAPSQMYQLFPITETQQAYWIGRNTVFELGNVGNHCYVEVEALEWNMARALLVLERLIQRHAMLRAVILPKGEQQILEQVPPSCIEYIDLQRLHQQHQDEQLLHIRREIDHHVYQVERWPAFVVRVSHLHEKRVRIHVSVEAVFADAWSMFLLVQEFVHLYHEPEASLPPLELSFRDYVLAKAQLQASELYERSRDYWLARIPTLPAAPDLPRASDTASLSRPRFVPRNGRMEAAQWQRLKARGAQAGLTPSGILLAAFAEVLAVWSKTPHFCINLTLFNRWPLHEQVNEIVGDFTSLLILEVDNAVAAPFEQRAKRLQEQFWQDFDARLYDGVRVLRELARQQGSTTQALMPVIFTSVLGQQTALTHPTPWQEIVYFVTQTPQVWLDHQVMEQVGHLVFYWHVVEELFPAGLIDDMFADYTQLLDRLAMDEAAWQSHSRELNSTSQPTQHTAANGQVSCYRPRHATLLLQEPDSGARVAQTPTEKTLSHLWCEMLNLSIVTVEENFLQLGGDSLLAIKLLARVQATCNVEVSLQAFFKNPTISALAKVIELYQVNQRGEDQSCEDVQVLSGSASSLEEEGIV